MKILHCHPIGELLERLAVEGDGHPSVSVKGELHAILHLWFVALLPRGVRVIFIPRITRFQALGRNIFCFKK